MTFGQTPISTTALSTNQFPAGSVYPPDTSSNNPNGDFVVLEAGPVSTDSLSNKSAPASMYVKGGNFIDFGQQSDSVATTDTGTFSFLAFVKRILQKLTSLNTNTSVLVDSFGSSTALTAATTFSGVPTVSQLAASSSVLLTNPGDQSTFQAAIFVASAFSGTLSFYGLEPDGATLQLISAHLRGTSTVASSTVITAVAATNQVWTGSIASFKAIYIICTAFTSGSVSVQPGLSAAPYAVSISNAQALGQNTMANSLSVAVASDQVVPVKRSTTAVYTLASTTTSGSTQNSGDLVVTTFTECSIDITTTAQAGTNPTLQYFYERKGADGLYYPLWQSAVLTLAANTLSTSIGAGMAYNQSLGLTGRLRWVIGGTSTPTYTHSITIYAK